MLPYKPGVPIAYPIMRQLIGYNRYKENVGKITD